MQVILIPVSRVLLKTLLLVTYVAKPMQEGIFTISGENSKVKVLQPGTRV